MTRSSWPGSWQAQDCSFLAQMQSNQWWLNRDSSGFRFKGVVVPTVNGRFGPSGPLCHDRKLLKLLG